MPYWRLFYHLVWTTKHRQPLLTSTVEQEVYGYMRSKAIGLGATLFALNGIEDHVHMVCSIPPAIAISKFVGQVKGVASTRFNKAHPLDEPFFWQAEYGAFSFDGKRLANFIAYVDRQKEHHRSETTIPVLERIEGEGVVRLGEPTVTYETEHDGWRERMLALG